MFDQFIVQNQEDNFDDADFLFMYNENLDLRENWFGSPNFLLLPKPQQTLRLIQWTRFEVESGGLSQLFFNGLEDVMKILKRAKGVIP